ncbi:MAG: VIT1/CCC1 transporter family protein [Egibacteraceae bacterium]
MTPADRPDAARRFAENRQDEIDSAHLYRAMAHGEQQPELAEVYRRLAATEERHAEFWAQWLRDDGRDVPAPAPSRRTRILGWLARRFGASLVAPTVAAAEAADQRMYDDQPEASGTSLPADERSHARVLRTLVAPTAGLEGGALARLEGRHRNVGGNALRAAVLGANDGLVSNLSLVMGVAGAALGQGPILVAGFAGLLAGAGSMALGEWISVQSSRELAERQLRVEAAEIAALPDEELEELALIYRAKGLDEAQARQVAEQLLADSDTALDVMAREELGIDPDELGGSPWVAAGSSFLLFALGAIVPVLPFLFATGLTAVAASVVASGLALFGIGAAITLLTGRPAWISGLRQLAFGLAAGAVTYGIGTAIGVSLAG